MRTNFEHLREYDELYDMALCVEKLLVEDQDMMSLTVAGSAMRKMAELMVDDMCVRYACECGQSMNRKIEGLVNAGIVNADTERNLREIQSIGTLCVHNIEPTKAQVEEMYRALYKESYKMVNYYLSDMAVNSYRQSGEAVSKEADKGGQKQGFWAKLTEPDNRAKLAIGLCKGLLAICEIVA